MKFHFFPLALLLSLNSNAQSDTLEINTPKNEVGITLEGFNSFGLTTKFELCKRRKTFWRLAASSINGDFSKSNNDQSTDKDQTGRWGIQFTTGIEKRFELVQNFNFYIGADLVSNFSINKIEEEIPSSVDILNEIEKRRTIQVGVGVPIGFNYTLKEIVVFGLEFEPIFLYRYSSLETKVVKTQPTVPVTTTIESYTEDITNGFSTGISTNSIEVSIAFQWQRRKQKD